MRSNILLYLQCCAPESRAECALQTRTMTRSRKGTATAMTRQR